MDAPSEGLAPLVVKQLAQQLQALKESSLSIVLVEQNVRMALQLADDVYIVERGRVV